MTSISGVLRLVLAVAVGYLLIASQDLSWPAGAYLAVGIAFVFGGLLTIGWPKTLRYRPLVGVLIDAATITLLIASTGWEDPLFSPLYFLAALGLIWVRSAAWIPIGIAALILGYAVGVAVPEQSFDSLLSPRVAFEAGLIMLFGGVAAFGRAFVRDLRQNEDDHASALATERRYVGTTELVASCMSPMLETLSVEERLRWTVETVCEVLEVPYAHATTTDGAFHQTTVRGDRDAYPSWWHPEVQRLVLWSCRTGEIVRSDAEVHDMGGFMTVPLVAEDGENVGAIVAGGRSFDLVDERALGLLVAPVASALADIDWSLGGLDPVTGVPNQNSLDRTLTRELSLGKSLALIMVGFDFSDSSARDSGFAARNSVPRTVGQRLEASGHRVFRCEDGTFAVLSREPGGRKTRALASKIKHVAEEAAGNSSISAAAGFAVAEKWQGDPSSLLEAARMALKEAPGYPDRVSEAGMAVASPAIETSGSLVGGDKVAQTVRAFEEAIEIRDPELAEHSRAVSKMSLLVGTRMALPAGQIETLAVGGLLHDLGKIGLPDSILNKPSALSPEEYEAIKQHPVLGARILALIPELSSVVSVVRHHHERFDGRGYPEGLRGEEVPLGARIVLVVDAFDSMTRDRVYRAGRDADVVLEEIARNAGIQFDPGVVEALQDVLAEPDGKQASL